MCCRFICLWHDSSHQERLTRFLFVAPCVCGTPDRGGFLPGCRHRHPVALPLYPSPPSGWVWDLLSLILIAMLNSPLRIRAVPGTQQINHLRACGTGQPTRRFALFRLPVIETLGFYNFHLLEKEVKKIWEIKVRRIRIRKQNKQT